MPNWCCNTLQIVAKTDEAKALLPQIRGRFEANRSDEGPSAFQLIHPMPSELENTRAPGDEPNWYDWRIENWGTKWPETCVDMGKSDGALLVVYFQTAWAPPIGVYSKLVSLGFEVFATYAEQGVGYAGYWDNGQDCEIVLSLHNVPVPEGEDYPEDYEVLKAAFAGTGIPDQLLPPGLGG